MNKLKNTQNIKKITMEPITYTKCVIGQDWYENHITIEFYPDDYYPDYTELRDWIMEYIDGKELNIEDIVDNIYKFIQNEYHPKQLNIRDNIINSKTHFNVIVEK